MMSNPLAPLRQALNVLCTEAEVLPATGQAIIDLVNSDEEENHDRQVSGNVAVTQIWETSTGFIHRKVRTILRDEAHNLRYFVDGSTRTYFIGTLLEGDRSSPVQISQVGAAMVRRENDGRIRTENAILRILLTVEESQLSDQILDKLKQSMYGLEDFVLCPSAVGNTLTDSGGSQEARPRGAHRANWYMRSLENDLASSARRDKNDWLIIDGSLGNEFETWQGPPIIGIAKSFSRSSRFCVGSGPRTKKINLYGLLKDLEDNQRSVVFSRSDEGKILFWYVRIRPQRGLDYPLMGVIKVEMPNPDRAPVDSEWIDEISGWIAAEHSVTPYGRDPRWHAHLYPIYIAERVIKARFYSEEVLKAGIRWPIPTVRPSV
jgi:hypothetical protein